MPHRKRRSSWGSITSYGRNKHVLRYIANTPEGRRRKSVTLNCTYKEATLERDRLRVINADKGDKPVPTIGRAYLMWYEPWLRRRVADGKAKENTLVAYTTCWKNVIEPRWGSVPADGIKPIEFQEWLLTLSAGNANHAIVILRKIIDFAVKYEVVPVNKLRLQYEMPIRKVLMRRSGTYTLEQAETMLGRLRGSIVEAAFIAACFGGARTGESLGQKPDEIKLVEAHGIKLAIVPIARRMEKAGDLPMPDGDLKNAQSERSTVIPEPYGTLYYGIAQQRIASGVEWMADRGDGLPLNVSGLKSAWESAAGKDSIPFANLRNSWRTFAQYVWGIDYDTLEFLMGHIPPGVTGKHYLKPTVENLVDAVAKAVAQSRLN